MADHDELLAQRGIRFGTVLHDGEHQQIWYEDKPLFGPDEWDNNEVAIAGFCAAIRELQGQLEDERGEREQLIADFDLLATDAESLCKERERATAAEARLATAFEETRERCAKVCDEHPGNLERNNWSSVGVLRDCVKLIRALEPAAQASPSVAGACICTHEAIASDTGRCVFCGKLVFTSMATADSPQGAAATNRRVRRLDRRAEPCPKIQLETPTAESLRLEAELTGMEEAAKIVLDFPNMPNGRENELLNMIVTEIRAEIARRKTKGQATATSSHASA